MSSADPSQKIVGICDPGSTEASRPLHNLGVRPEFANVRRIFFDLDDTLCGYWDASKAALRKTFEEHRPDHHGTEDLVKQWAAAFREFSPTIKGGPWYPTYLKTGEPTRIEQMRLTLARLGIVDPELATRLSTAYATHRDSELALFPDALPVLEALSTRYPLGLITNGPADIQRQEIETLGIGRFFDAVYIEGEMGRGKPLPEVFDEITAAAGVEPNEILMVGNSYAHDIRPALRAGWLGVWIRRDSDVPPSYEGGDVALEQRPEGDPAPTAEIGALSDLLALLNVD